MCSSKALHHPSGDVSDYPAALRVLSVACHNKPVNRQIAALGEMLAAANRRDQGRGDQRPHPTKLFKSPRHRAAPGHRFNRCIELANSPVELHQVAPQRQQHATKTLGQPIVRILAPPWQCRSQLRQNEKERTFPVIPNPTAETGGASIDCCLELTKVDPRQ
jgi:hypothetical protein